MNIGNDIKQKKWEQEFPRIIPKFFTPRIVQTLKPDLQFNPHFKQDYYNWLNKGNWLFITGNAGTGKTILASHYMMYSMYQSYLHKNSRLIADHKFTSSINILDSLKNSFNDGTSLETENKIFDIPFLVIDELGSEKLTDWSLSMIYKLLNHRYEYLLATIITSNFNEKELKDMLDDRIVARIYEVSKRILLTKMIRGSKWNGK